MICDTHRKILLNKRISSLKLNNFLHLVRLRVIKISRPSTQNQPYIFVQGDVLEQIDKAF